MRPFRFLADGFGVVDGKKLAERARHAESIGYSVLVLSDHLLEQLAPIPAMATIAAATEQIRVGTFVFNNDLRHPAVLAQDLATLDVLSGGRLEIGIGAGWNQPEYEEIGLPFEPAATRVGRLEESVAVLKGLFADGSFSFDGTHYTIRERDGQPKPVQKPHPPLMIGGGGRRVLSLAAREANIVSLAPRIFRDGRGDPTSITMAATAEKIGWVREAAGDHFGDLELNVYPSMSEVIVTDHARAEVAKLRDQLRERTGREISEDELLESPQVFIGSIDGLIEKFQALREGLGISSFMLGDIDQLAPVVERLAGT
jgi:probable F420-dependent oxidoreductase